MRHKFAVNSPWLLILCALAVLCLSQVTQAQSGRRQNKTAPPPPPVITPTTTEQPTAAVKPVKPAAAATVIVGGDRFNASFYIHGSYVDEVVRACIDRLENSTGLAVTSGGNMSRKDAIDRAKKETVASVVWLELREERDGSSDISISYSVFTAQTGKVLTSGRVYPGSRGVGTGGVVVGIPTVNRRLPLQYQLRDGGEQVADRVRGKLHRTSPD